MSIKSAAEKRFDKILQGCCSPSLYRGPRSARRSRRDGEPARAGNSDAEFRTQSASCTVMAFANHAFQHHLEDRRLHAAPVVPPAELTHIAVQMPGTELVIVADDGPLE